tara:strand:+ start:953 stop:1243 length:291 start_codon:yes stop_codon:yes gene_type:complete
MRGYYSVFNPRGEKIADCGMERDAVTLMSSRNQRWDGHYFTFNPLPGDIIDVSDHRLNGNDLKAEPRGLPPYTASIAAEIEVDLLPESGSTPIDVK